MKSYKIRDAQANNRTKKITINTAKGKMALPYSKLPIVPSTGNRILKVYVDNELDKRAITYELEDGHFDSVPLDAFLDFNKDPEYLREIELHRLTVLANKAVKSSGMSKREICRKMNTSLSQLSRILDPTNYSKTFDQLLKLFAVLGIEVKIDAPSVA